MPKNSAAAAAAPEAAPQAPAAAAAAAARQTPLRKLTVSRCFPIKASELPDTGETVIGRMAGTAVATRDGATQYGPWTAFVGQFAAIDARTGEMFVAGEAFVPGPLGDELIAGFKRALAEDASTTMQFSVTISAIKSKRGGDGAGYEFVVRSDMPWQSNSPAVALLQQFAPAGLISNT